MSLVIPHKHAGAHNSMQPVYVQRPSHLKPDIVACNSLQGQEPDPQDILPKAAICELKSSFWGGQHCASKILNMAHR